MPLHRNIYSFVYRGEDAPESRDVIWIHHEKRNDIQSAMIAEIWIKNKWEPLIWGSYKTDTTTAECCCCGSPFVREEGKASAAMREASNIAKGAFAFSAGHKSKALADHSVAIGSSLIADKPYQTVLGRYNNNDTNALFVIGIGDSEENRLNAIEIDAVGNVNIPKLNIPQTERVWNLGSGEYSAELPGGSSASGDNSVAMGLDNVSSGDFSLTSGIDSVASGKCSSAFGSGSKAAGMNAFATGSNGEATGKGTFVFGHRSKALGDYSIAGGWACNALGDNSVALGFYANSNEKYSFSTGYQTQANGRYGFVANYYTVITNEAESAFGKYNRLNNNQIFSIGIGTSESSRENAFEVYSSGEVNIPNLRGYVKTELLRTDEDLRSVSLGFGATATGEDSIAVGRYTYATGDKSQAFGSETEAKGYASHTEGYYTTAIGDNSHAEGIRTMSYGDGSHAEGNAIDTYECVSFGAGSHAEGSSIATGERAHSEGVSNLIEVEIEYSNGTIDTSHMYITADIPALLEDLNVSGRNDVVGKFFQIDGDFYQVQSIVDNDNDNFTIGIYPAMLHFSNTNTMVFQMGGAQGRTSHTEGSHCVAYGNDSHAEGAGCITYGDDAHAEGIATVARGDHSHAEGDTSEANGSISHAEGDHCIANGDQSHAGGCESSANGDNSFAFGYACDTEGNSNIAMGHNVFTNGAVLGEFACGKFNNPSATTIFSLGIGADGEHRKNAIEVLADGTIRFYNSGDGNYYTLQQIINAINS